MHSTKCWTGEPKDLRKNEPRGPPLKVEKHLNWLWSPNQCGSVGWATYHKVKGHQFDSSQDTCLSCGFDPQPGYMWGGTDRCFSLTSMFLSFSFSLPSPLFKNKIINWLWNHLALNNDFPGHIRSSQAGNESYFREWNPGWLLWVHGLSTKTL